MNPDWTRDEIILALDLYFKDKKAAGLDDHPDVIQLSKLLNNLPIHPISKRDASFRNPNGVGMKLANFQRFDPDYGKAGLKAGSKLEEELWYRYCDNREELHQTAEAIKAGYKDLKETDVAANSEDEEFDAPEGRILTALHYKRERSRTLVKKKKQQILQKLGSLKCEACEFDFGGYYGKVGEGFIECHHEIPISTLEEVTKTKLSDLRLLCSNCHRILHRAKPWLSVAELKEIIARQRPATR